MTYWSRIIEQLFKHLIWQNNQIVREVFWVKGKWVVKAGLSKCTVKIFFF